MDPLGVLQHQAGACVDLSWMFSQVPQSLPGRIRLPIQQTPLAQPVFSASTRRLHHRQAKNP